MTAETIYALSSGRGQSGVAVIRLSGPAAWAIAGAMIGRTPVHRRAMRCDLTDPESGELLDDGLCLGFQGPGSFTGEDVVEFKKPNHSLEDVIGNRKLLNFLREKLIPRLKSTGDDAIVGAAVGGPIGCGKTFIFEGLAGDLDMPVIVLKNIKRVSFGVLLLIIKYIAIWIFPPLH